MKSSSIRVAVRLRPINEVEKARGDDRIVEVKERSIRIADPTTGKIETFSYDDVLGIDKNQDMVYDTIGATLVDQAYQGYNCCILAYGMTGSGKTHTMLGNNDGLIPHICQNLFDRAASSGANIQCEVSFIEIYGESVRDLLDRTASLKIRNGQHGVFVQGLTTVAVADANKIMQLIESGTRARAVAHTKCNETSSRSHAIFTIYWKQIKVVGGVKRKISSKINLVDLAGSEKVNVSGVKGQALEEAIQINGSLSHLAKVIDELVTRSKHISYRNTPLTHILSDSLGGNSKTIFLAAISPASSNYHQTRSTLRYADQAKKIKINATINESVEMNVDSLKAEIESLKRQLEDAKSANQEDLLAQLAEKEQQLKDETIAWENRLQETEQVNRKIIESITGQLQVSQSETQDMKQRIEGLKQEIEKIKKESADLARISDLEIAKLKMQIVVHEEQIRQTKKEQQEKEKKIKQDLAIKDKEIVSLTEQKTKLTNDVIVVQRQLDEQKNQIDDLHAQLEGLSEEKSLEIAKLIKEKDEEIARLTGLLEEHKTRIAELEKIIKEKTYAYEQEIEQITNEYTDDISSIIGQHSTQHKSSLSKLRDTFREKYQQQELEISRLKTNHQEIMDKLIQLHKEEIAKYKKIITQVEKRSALFKTLATTVTKPLTAAIDKKKEIKLEEQEGTTDEQEE